MRVFDEYRHHWIIGNPEIGVLFFGMFYLAYRGLWGHFFLFLLLAFPTCGFIWIWYIFNTRTYLTRKYFMEGYFF